MDIDKLFESESLDGIADNVFGVVNNSVSEVKEMQRKKVAENVQLVVNALKKIESDISSRYDSVGNALEKRIITIKDGRDGADGSDGRNGRDGKNGRDGAPGPRGADGKNGLDGADGTDGVSVTNAHIDFDGSLVISLSSGQELNVGEVVAPALAEQIKVITNGGGTSQSVIDTLASLQAQITAISGASIYKGLWNASTNTPTLTSSVGTSGNFYIVSVAGSTNLNGITNWGVGDWAIYNGTAWQRVEGGAEGNFTTLSASGAVTFSSLTSGRVTYAGTAGLLQDSANLTFNGTTLTANTIGAFTLSGTVAGGGNQLNNVIIGTTTPLAGAFTALSATGLISNTGGNTNAMAFTGATTNYQYISMANTTANMTLGVERSTGGGLIVGSTGYDVALSNSGGGISFGVTGNALGMRLSSTGLAVTGTLSATGLTLDSTGTLGLGVTPIGSSAGAFTQLQIGGGSGKSTFYGQNNDHACGLVSGAYFNSSSQYVYASSTKRVSNLYMYDGSATIQYAPIGTTGNTFTPTNIAVFSSTGLAVTGTLSATTTGKVGTTLGVGAATPSASGAGITFPATQSASTDANTLDDYEEGTWTPSIGGTATYNQQIGRYTKIGRMVYVTAILQVNIIGTGSTSQISGLPFSGASGYSGAEASLSVSYFTNIASSVVTLFSNATVSSVQFYGLTAAATGTSVISPFQNGARIDFAGWYIAAN